MSRLPELHLPLYPSGILSAFETSMGLSFEATIPNVIVDLSLTEDQAIRLKDYLKELYE